jgi:hypothetical protein
MLSPRISAIQITLSMMLFCNHSRLVEYILQRLNLSYPH